MHSSSFDRRDFLRFGALGLAASSMLASSRRLARISAATLSARQFQVVDVRRTTVCVPYREIPERNMARELPHWKYSEVFEVQLASGQVGIGETLLYYTWGVSTDEHVQQVMGQNAAEWMWNGSLGAGLQIALFDAVARTAEVPVHALLGRQVHQRTPLSWWNIDTSPEDMAAECQEALRQGYTAYKTKGRPWFDVWKQAELVAKAVPEHFKLDMDFNDTLLDAPRAIPILQDLEKYPQVGIYESPIFQDDIEGNQAIRQATRVPLAMHYGNPDPTVAIREEICDGFVIGGNASHLIAAGSVAAEADLPFWLQLVGTGITAAWSLHVAAVLSHATWPAVNCHQLYTHTLLQQPITVREGFAEVPDRPGLGFDLDREAIERFRVEKPAQRPDPPRLIETTWPDGRRLYVAPTGEVNFMLNPARAGKIPFFEQGVTTQLLPDDGSSRWRELYEQARKAPLLIKG